MKIKSFITLGPGHNLATDYDWSHSDGEVVFEVSRPVGKVIKLFFFVTNALDNKLGRLRLQSFL